MSWVTIITLILSIVGPAVLPQILEWLKLLMNNTARNMDNPSPYPHPVPNVFTPDAGIRTLFARAYANMSWWDWLVGRGYLLRRVEQVMLDKAEEIWTVAAAPTVRNMTPLSKEQVKEIQG